MARTVDALRQAFKQKHEYESLREEDNAWYKLQKPLILLALMVLCVHASISTEDNSGRSFCGAFLDQRFLVNFTTESGGNGGDVDGEMEFSGGVCFDGSRDC